MECHPVCDLFPAMPQEDFARLCEDIAANGQHLPIVTHDGQIVDGRHRYNACCLLGIAPKFEEWSGNGSLVAYVKSLNLERRHMDTSQRGAAAAKAAELLEEEGRERQRIAAKATNAKRRGESLCLDSDKALDDEPWDSLGQAAEMFGVARCTVADAAKVMAEAPDQFERIRAGEITVHAARKALNGGHARPKETDRNANVVHADFRVSDDPETYYRDWAGGLKTYFPMREAYASLIVAMQEELAAWPA
jgi:hypothetical protein